MKKVKVILSPEAEEVYNYLNKKAVNSKIEKSILNALNKKIELIKENIHYGNPISKNKIPIEFKKKYGTTNLFRVELPSYWRFLYSLSNSEDEIEIIAFVLDISDHDKYNEVLGYK